MPSLTLSAYTLGFAVLFNLPYSSASAGGRDMSAEFKRLKTCGDCIEAGYGWCPVRRMCGGFANKECGIGPNYVREDYSASTASAKKPKPAKKEEQPHPGPARGTANQGNDMSATFAKLRDCTSCVGAGFGWCPNLRKCGGFANRECGLGPRYVAEGPPARNGIWKSKKEEEKHAEAEAPPAAEVPKASAPPPATLLYAGPASPPPPSKVSVTVSASASTTTVAAAVNETTEPGVLAEALDELTLKQSSRGFLVQRILDLQAEVQKLRVV
jgi:hypothetical protein